MAIGDELSVIMGRVLLEGRDSWLRCLVEAM